MIDMFLSETDGAYGVSWVTSTIRSHFAFRAFTMIGLSTINAFSLRCRQYHDVVEPSTEKEVAL